MENTEIEKYNIIGRVFYRYQYSILQLCEDLHMYCTGGRDCYEPVTPVFIYLYLKERLKHWKPGLLTNNWYDETIKQLIMASISGYDNSEIVPNINDVKKYLKNNPGAKIYVAERVKREDFENGF